MKYILGFLLGCAPLGSAGGIFGRQRRTIAMRLRLTGALFLRDMFSTGRIMIISIIPSTRNSSVSGLIVGNGHRADLRIVLEGMLQLDTNTSPPPSNISVPSYIGSRMNGAIIHVSVRDQGVIVQISGQTTIDSTPYGIGS